MGEPTPKLRSALEIQREERLEKLRNLPSGFMFEQREGKNIVVFLGLKDEIGGSYSDHIVEFETDITTPEEVERIVSDVKPSVLIRKIWTFIIDAYNQHEIPLIQSLPGTGKTHAFHRFQQLLHGDNRDVTKEDIICTPKTCELEILGKWVPNGQHGIGINAIRDKLDDDRVWAAFTVEFESRLAGLFNRKDDMTEEEFAEQRSAMDKEYQEKQLEVLIGCFPSIDKGQWEFVEGGLTRAYQNTDNPNDVGGFLLVDEVDNLPENYQNIFLQIAGEGGQLASKITTYSGTGKKIYRRGPKTFVAFAANYPEFSTGKRSISAPLADRVTWLSITPEEARNDEKLRIEKFSFQSLAKKLKEIPNISPETIENIRSLCSQLLAAFHMGWKMNLPSYNKIQGWGGNELTREQTKEFSQRTTARVESFITENLHNPEFTDGTGKPDFARLMEYAITTGYKKFLASEAIKRQVENELLLPLFYGGRKYLEQKGDKFVLKEHSALKEGPFTFVLDNGIVRPFDVQKDKGKKDIMAFDEAIKMLTEKAFRTEAEIKASLDAKRRGVLDFDLDAAITPKSKKNAQKVSG